MCTFPPNFSIRTQLHIAPFNKYFLYLIKQFLTDYPFVVM